MNEEEQKALAAQVAEATKTDARAMVADEVKTAMVDPETVSRMAEAVAAKLPKTINATETGSEDRAAVNADIRALVAGDKQNVRASVLGNPLSSTQTETHGKELVQPTVASEVLMPDAYHGLVDKYAYNFLMPSGETRIPTVDAITANLNAEGDILGYQGLTTGMIKAQAFTLNAIVPLTRELVDDSEYDLYSLIATLASSAFSRLRDQVVFGVMDGQSSSSVYKSLGILTNDSVTRQTLTAGKTSFADVTLDDIILANSKLRSESKPILVANRTLLASMLTQKNNAGVRDWDLAVYAKGLTPMGIPFDTSELLPSVATASQADKDFAFLADFSRVMHGYRTSVTMEISNTAVLTDIPSGSSDRTVKYNAFQDNLIFIKVTARESFLLRDADKNFVALHTSAS